MPFEFLEFVSGFGPDDGSTVFAHNDQVLTVEIFEFPGLVGETVFGFFFESDPSTLIPLFDELDFPSPQTAAVDFSLGLIFGVDSPAVPTPFAGSGNIGFYLTVNPVLVTLYSLPSLNVGGIDHVVTFPFLANPSIYEIGFENPVSSDFPPIALEVVVGVRPVPEPSTALLLSVGAMLGMSVRARRSRLP